MKDELIQIMYSLRSSFAVGIIAGLLRVLVHPDKHWKEKVGIFTMSILLAVLVAIILDDWKVNYEYRSAIIAATALLGKEALEATIKYTPTAVRNFINKYFKINLTSHNNTNK